MYLSGFQNAAGKREKEKGRERKGEDGHKRALCASVSLGRDEASHPPREFVAELRGLTGINKMCGRGETGPKP